MNKYRIQDKETGEWSTETYTMEELSAKYKAQEITVRPVQQDGSEGESRSITPEVREEPSAGLWATTMRNLRTGWTNWSGRSTCREFWVLWLATAIIYALFRLAFFWMEEEPCFAILDVVVCVALFIPVLSCMVRRRHDVGKSGSWLLYCSPLLFLVHSAVLGMFIFTNYGIEHYEWFAGEEDDLVVSHGQDWLANLYLWFNQLYGGGIHRYDYSYGSGFYYEVSRWDDSSPLLTSILLVLFALVFILMMRDSQKGTNQWGVSPKYGEDGTKCPPVDVTSAGMFKLTGRLFSKTWSDWHGRATRREYWLGSLGVFICQLPMFSLLEAMFSMHRHLDHYPMQMLLAIVLYAVNLLVFGAVGWNACARRLHDTGRSGWWVLASILPVFNIVVLIFTLLDSAPGRNKYGLSVKYPFSDEDVAQMKQLGVSAKQYVFLKATKAMEASKDASKA